MDKKEKIQKLHELTNALNLHYKFFNQICLNDALDEIESNWDISDWDSYSLEPLKPGRTYCIHDEVADRTRSEVMQFLAILPEDAKIILDWTDYDSAYISYTVDKSEEDFHEYCYRVAKYLNYVAGKLLENNKISEEFMTVDDFAAEFLETYYYQ